MEHLSGEAGDGFPKADKDVLNLGLFVGSDGGEFGHDDGGVHGPEGEEIILRMEGVDAEGFER